MCILFESKWIVLTEFENLLGIHSAKNVEKYKYYDGKHFGE